MARGIGRRFPLATRWYGNVFVIVAMSGLCLSMVLGTYFNAGCVAWFYHPAVDPLWRGMLAQLIHFDVVHLLGNLFMLLALWLAAGCLRMSVRMLFALMYCVLMVSVGLHFEYTPLAWYAGLSGAMHGLFAWLLLEFIQSAPSQAGRLGAYIVFLSMTLKVVAGISPVVFSMPVAHSAHLYGFMAGIVYVLVTSAKDYLRCRMPV